MWVLNGGRRDALFAYEIDGGGGVREYALDPASGDPHDIWSDGTTVWVSGHGAGRLLAYRLPAVDGEAETDDVPRLERVPDEDFTTLSGVGNNSPRGIWSDGDVMYVADEGDDRVYPYGHARGDQRAVGRARSHRHRHRRVRRQSDRVRRRSCSRRDGDDSGGGGCAGSRHCRH